MYVIQTWGFRGGCVSQSVGDRDKARRAMREAFRAVYVREVCIWRPHPRATIHATRQYPAGPWRFIKKGA